MEITLHPEAADAGVRLDAYLAARVEGLTRSAAARLAEEGLVTAGERALQKNYKLQGGETILVRLPEPEPTDVAAQDIPLDVVYEDEDVIVVNKPVGMVVHPAPGHSDGTLVNALLHHCGQSLSGIGGQLRPGIVHRIDRDTSGLIIAAKNDFAHQSLAAQLQDHSLARTYRAVVVGNLREDEGTVDAPIGRHPTDRKRMAVTDKNSRAAVTHWQVLERFRGPQQQIPPMYSAIKIGGQKLYDLARKGQEVERKPRSVIFYELELLEQVSETDFVLRCLCSKGTYIRTLCHDIGQALGCGGAMYSLRRTMAAAFTADQAVTLEDVQSRGEELLLPTDSLFSDHPILLLKSDKLEKRVRCGNPITLPGTADGTYRVYGQGRQFLCLSRAEGGVLTSIKNFFGA